MAEQKKVHGTGGYSHTGSAKKRIIPWKKRHKNENDLQDGGTGRRYISTNHARTENRLSPRSSHYGSRETLDRSSHYGESHYDKVEIYSTYGRSYPHSTYGQIHPHSSYGHSNSGRERHHSAGVHIPIDSTLRGVDRIHRPTIPHGSYMYIPGYEGKAVFVDSHLTGRRAISAYKGPKKDYAISYFGIKFDQPEKYCYQPGDIISGKVILDVQFPIAVRGVEFKITGFGTATVIKEGFITHRKRECYLTKKSTLFGGMDSRATMINPGHYISHFKYVLPNTIPSSVFTEDIIKTTMYKLDVSYTAQAQVYDDVVIKSNSITKGRGGYKFIPKAIKSVSRSFRVINPQNIDTNPQPVCHTEYLNRKKKESHAILLDLNSCVIYVGKEIKLNIDSDVDTAKVIQEINIELHKTVAVTHSGFKHSKVVHEYHHDTRKAEISGNIVTWMISFTLPDSTVPSYTELPDLVNISYILKAMIKLPNKWMNMQVPLDIFRMPKEEINADLPVFRNVRRFPQLTDSLHKDSSSMGNGSAYRVKDVKVDVSYDRDVACTGSNLLCLS